MSETPEAAWDPMGTATYEDGTTAEMSWSDWSEEFWRKFREREAERQAEMDRRAALIAPAWEQVLRLSIQVQREAP